MNALALQGKLAIQCMENTILAEPGDTVRPMQACRRPQIVGRYMEKVPNYRVKWLPSEKNQNIQVEISEAALKYSFIMQ